MLIDMKLFALLAVLVIVVGAYLWLKPKGGNASNSKNSGVGDIGQAKNKK